MEFESTLDEKTGVFVWLLVGAFLLAIAYSVIHAFIGAIILGVFVYYCSRPIYRKLGTIIPYNTITALVTMGLFFTPFIIIFYYTLATAIQEIQQIIFEYGFNELQPYFEPYINFEIIRLIETPETIISQSDGLNLITGLLDYTVLVSGLIGDVLIMLIVTVTITFYLLVDDGNFRDWIDSQMEVISYEFTEFADLVDEDLSSIYFGNILNAIFTATIGIGVFMAYEIITPSQLQIVFPVLLGLLAGAFSLIPMVGTKPVYIPTTLYLSAVVYFNKLPPEMYVYPIGFFIISAIIVDFIPDMILRPYVSGRNIHLGLLLIAYISGPIIFGWYGFFLMPLFAVIFQHYYTLIFPKMTKKIVEIHS